MKNKSIKRKKHCQRQVYDDRKVKTKLLGGITFIALLFIVSTLSAQESVVSAGGDGSGSGGSVAFSVGQALYTSSSGTTGTAESGVQMPFEIFVVTGIEEQSISLKIDAYPNPVVDYLVLKITDDLSIQEKYVASLYDISGKLIMEKQLKTNETKIEMAGLSPSTYFLKVTKNNKESKSFKIIKK